MIEGPWSIKADPRAHTNLQCSVSRSPTMPSKSTRLAASLLPFLSIALGNPLGDLEKRACPQVHVFGARETTAPAGYGTSLNVVNSIVAAYSGATSEAINYPACGGQSSCGGVSYANSVVAGIQAVTSAVNSYNTQCPNTFLVLVGYSQVMRNRLILAITENSQSYLIRVVKSSMMPTAVVVTPTRATPTLLSPSRPPLKPRSRLPSSWVTRATSLASRTTLVLATHPE